MVDLEMETILEDKDILEGMIFLHKIKFFTSATSLPGPTVIFVVLKENQNS